MDRDDRKFDKIIFEELDDFVPEASMGQHRWSGVIAETRRLEALGLNRGSDVLIVSLHGATDRKKYVLPRFERFATLADTEYSSLYFGDPTLNLSRDLELAWYTGWRGLNCHFWIAEWTRRVAKAFGCSKIVFCGSSGGGFASLQSSAYLPGSLAVPFNPQTSVISYLVDGERDHAQRRYCQYVFPDLVPNGWASRDPQIDWTASLGDLTSAVLRYSSPLANYVYYAQNSNDFFHVRDHQRPFRETLDRGMRPKHVRKHFYFEDYAGPNGHVVPDRSTYLGVIERALGWYNSVS